MHNHLTRRDLLSLGTKSLLTASLVGMLQTHSLATEEGHEFFEDWLLRLQENGKRLGRREQTGLQWQEQMDSILAEVPLESLLQHVDFERMAAELQSQDLTERGEIFVAVNLDDPEAEPSVGPEPGRVLITKIAHIQRGRSIPPHGHSNMVSAFLCVSGEFDVRLFDRLEDQPQHMIVRQTADEVDAGPGTWSSISDYRSNVHWLTAKSDDCFLFTTKLIHLEEDRPTYGRINVDVRAGEVLGTNTIRAPKISSTEAAERY